jgi:hypothetical protein
MWGKKLLINTMLKVKLIERCIPELSPAVTTNTFQAVGMFIIQPQSQAPKVLKHFILTFQEETQEGPTVSIWSNCPGCLIITVLTGEWEAAIILS